MAAVMVERDAVLAAVGGLMGEALEGRGGALFVVGEAGLGKTTVLEHAVAAAAGRFKVGIGRADVAEAALPFGLICRRVAALPVAVLVTARPWPPEALRAGEELAAQQLAVVQQLVPLSPA